MKSKQKEESDINVGLMAEMDTIYNDKEVLRSDSKLSKILHKISTRSVNSLQDLISLVQRQSTKNSLLGIPQYLE